MANVMKKYSWDEEGDLPIAGAENGWEVPPVQPAEPTKPILAYIKSKIYKLLGDFNRGPWNKEKKRIRDLIVISLEDENADFALNVAMNHMPLVEKKQWEDIGWAMAGQYHASVKKSQCKGDAAAVDPSRLSYLRDAISIFLIIKDLVSLKLMKAEAIDSGDHEAEDLLNAAIAVFFEG